MVPFVTQPAVRRLADAALGECGLHRHVLQRTYTHLSLWLRIPIHTNSNTTHGLSSNYAGIISGFLLQTISCSALYWDYRSGLSDNYRPWFYWDFRYGSSQGSCSGYCFGIVATVYRGIIGLGLFHHIILVFSLWVSGLSLGIFSALSLQIVSGFYLCIISRRPLWSSLGSSLTTYVVSKTPTWYFAYIEFSMLGITCTNCLIKLRALPRC